MAWRHRRGSWRGVALLAAAAASLVAPCGRPSPGAPGGVAGADAVEARVLDVTDGDTILVSLPGGDRESVRYIGVNTPESTPNQPLECFGHEAADANAALVGGRSVALEFGPERRDDYGRLLAYVFVPPATFVNAELVARGYARTLEIAPNDARAPLFSRLETGAARAGRGLWGACAPMDG